jgi:hypothetical protein
VPAADPGGGGHERALLDDEWHWTASGSALAGTAEEARAAAVAQARAALAALQRVHIIEDWCQVSRSDNETYDEEITKLLVQRVRTHLDRARVVEAAVERAGTQFAGRARVAVPERALFPGKRLEALVRAPPGEENVRELVALAQTYEAEDVPDYAEQALKHAADRGGAGAALALAQHYGRRDHSLDALRWARLAARAADPQVAREAQALIDRLSSYLPTARELAEELRRHALARQDATLFSARVAGRAPAGGEEAEYRVYWTIAGREDRRVLKTWIDREHVSPAFWASDEGDAPEASDRHGGVEVVTRPGELVLWALPVEADVWPRALALKDADIPLDAASEEQRYQLRDLLRALRGCGAVASVLPLGS